MFRKIIAGFIAVLWLWRIAEAQDQWPNQQLKGYNVSNVEDLIDLPPDQIEISKAVLLFCKIHEPKLAVEDFLKQIDDIAKPIYDQIQLEKIQDPIYKLELISGYLYNTLKFEYTDQPEVQNLLLYRVLETKKGHCLGLVTLYLCISQRLNIDLKPVLSERHVFQKKKKKETIFNVETGEKGAYVPQDLYFYSPQNVEGIKTGFFCKPLANHKDFIAFYAAQMATYMIPNLATAPADLDKAETLLELALALNPQDFTALRMVGYLTAQHPKTPDPQSAIEPLKQALAANPMDFMAAVSLSNCYIETGKMNEAINVLERTISLGVIHPILYTNLAYCYIDQKKYDQAIRAAVSAIWYDPAYVPAHLNLAQAYLNLKRYRDLAWVADKIIILNPSDAVGYILLMNAYLGLLQPSKAQETYQKLVSQVNLNLPDQQRHKKKVEALKSKIDAVLKPPDNVPQPQSGNNETDKKS